MSRTGEQGVARPVLAVVVVGLMISAGCAGILSIDDLVFVVSDAGRDAPTEGDDAGDGGAPPDGSPRVASIVTGAKFTCALLEADRSVRCWGANDNGQLGGGESAGPPIARVVLPGRVTELTAAEHHACAVLEDGRLYCWGRNANGELGVETGFGGTTGVVQPSPVLVSGVPRMVHVACGGQHTCAITHDGHVYCWGRNHSGQLARNVPGAGDGGLPASPQPQEITTRIEGDGGVLLGKAIAAGDPFTCVLAVDDRVYCWGGNLEGQLGLDEPEAFGSVGGAAGNTLRRSAVPIVPSPKAVIARGKQACVVGDPRCWGLNTTGQLGLGDTKNRGDETGEMSALPRLDLGAGVLTLSAGLGHTCAVLVGGDVKCWGANESGQLGYGDVQNRGDDPAELGLSLPTIDLGEPAREVSAGGAHTCALLKSGRVKCWGANESGQLGTSGTERIGDGPNEMGSSLPYVNIPE